MQYSPAFSFILVVISSIFIVVLAFLTGSHGLEAFYITSIGLFFLFVWFSIQLLKRLYRMKTWLIAKVILTIAQLGLLGVAGILTVASWPIDSVEPVNGWFVAAGLIPFLVPRLGVYKKIDATNKISAGILIIFFTMILLTLASQSFQTNTNGVEGYLLVAGVQLQFVLCYLVLQTDYVERFLATVDATCKSIGIKDKSVYAYVILLTAGLPFIVPLAVLLYFASRSF